jgi:hypothetical protein
MFTTINHDSNNIEAVGANAHILCGSAVAA